MRFQVLKYRVLHPNFTSDLIAFIILQFNSSLGMKAENVFQLLVLQSAITGKPSVHESFHPSVHSSINHSGSQ